MLTRLDSYVLIRLTFDIQYPNHSTCLIIHQHAYSLSSCIFKIVKLKDQLCDINIICILVFHKNKNV